MNKFDRAVNKKRNELMAKDIVDKYVDKETFKKYTLISRAMIREEERGVKPNDDSHSLYGKTWKTARKYHCAEQDI